MIYIMFAILVHYVHVCFVLTWNPDCLKVYNWVGKLIMKCYVISSKVSSDFSDACTCVCVCVHHNFHITFT